MSALANVEVGASGIEWNRGQTTITSLRSRRCAESHPELQSQSP